MALITDPDDLNQGTEVTITTGTRQITLNQAGNLSTDGVTLQALYSFLKEEWKNDANLIPHPFPMTAITPEQFEWINDWEPTNNSTRELIRTGGWREVDENGVIKVEYVGVISLGSFEDPNADLAYYQYGNDPTDTGAANNFVFNGPLNEAILSYEENVGPDAGTGFDFANSSPDTIVRNDAGSWITDGYVVGGQVTVLNATTPGNNGTYYIGAVTASTLTVYANSALADAGLTADTGDNTATFARNYRNAIKLFLRVRDGDPNGKSYSQADLEDIGVTEVRNQVYRFPLSNATDLKIAETDANISSTTPYTEILVRYLDEAYNREVDSTTKRNFGIVVDVGTYSQANGVSNGTTLFTSAAIGDITVGDYTGGSLIIHEGTDQGTHTISGTPVNNGGTLEVTLSSALTGSETSVSFTLQRATPVVATAEEIYEKVQYLLRQAADIDGTSDVVTGRTADELLAFVGDALKAGSAFPVNPNGGGSGVIIEGFDSNDTNRLSFFDNGAVERTFPFVAAGTIFFNPNLVSDGSAEYWMFFEYTERFTNTGFGISSVSGSNATLDSSVLDLTAELANGDYIKLDGFVNENLNGIWQLTGAPAGTGPWTAAVTRVDNKTIANESAGATVSLDKNPINSPDAILVDDNSGADITGTIGGASVGFDFDYDGNVQGGRTFGTDAAIVLRAIGLSTAQFVEVTGTITRNTGLSFSLVAALERNYENL